jgi:hypothetical protein
VDPTTLVGFGEDLWVDIGDGNGYRGFGLSPAYVDVIDGRSGFLAPFAIAASSQFENRDGTPRESPAPDLAAPFVSNSATLLGPPS